MERAKKAWLFSEIFSPYFCVFKYARAVKQKVWNEAENSEGDWGESFLFSRLTLARALRARKTITPHFPFFFSADFEKKPTVLQSTVKITIDDS